MMFGALLEGSKWAEGVALMTLALLVYYFIIILTTLIIA